MYCFSFFLSENAIIVSRVYFYVYTHTSTGLSLLYFFLEPFFFSDTPGARFDPCSSLSNTKRCFGRRAVRRSSFVTGANGSLLRKPRYCENGENQYLAHVLRLRRQTHRASSFVLECNAVSMLINILLLSSFAFASLLCDVTERYPLNVSRLK